MIQQDPEVLQKACEALTAVYTALGASPTSPNTVLSEDIPEIAEIKTASDNGDIAELNSIIIRYVS